MVARIIITALILLFVSCPISAKEIAGVAIDEQISQSDGTTLHFNGAGIRSKFVFKVYLAMLYLENPNKDRQAMISDSGSKQLIMHFLYKKVGKDDLVEA